jgi:Tol biopolymer transport system component
MTIVTLSVALGGAVLVARQRTADVALRAAIETETVRGDVKGAIEQYKHVVETYGKSDRAIAAQALLRMAEAHQKLGDSEAQTIYQRVIREYPDQKEVAAMARARVDGTGAGGRDSRMVARQVWTAPPKGDIFGTVSRDGRLIPYVNWADSGNLFVHDLASGSDRRVTNTASDGQAGVAGDYAQEATFSRNGKQLAYAWFKGRDRRYDLRIIPLQGTGVPAPRQLFDNEDVGWMSPDDWSPDGKWLAVRLTRKDRTAQIGVVAVQDGSLRVLKSVDWRGTTRLLFSADGKYLAFDLPAGETTEQRDVFVLATDGSQEIPVAVHPSQDVLVGWSPDSKRVLFASDRSGSMGLWAVGFAQGKVQGTPELLKPDIGRNEFMGLAADGALYSAAGNSGAGSDIRVATLDFATGRFLSPPVTPIQTYVGSNELPDWSPDGKYLAYASLRGTVGTRYFVIGIRSTETGQTRELTPSPGFFLLQSLVWAPDGRSFTVAGRDIKGREGIFRVDALTGQTTVIVAREENEGPRFLAWSLGGEKLYYRGRSGGQEWAVIERDLASGKERELIRKPFVGAFYLSPDGRFIAAGTVDSKSAAAVLVPIAGGEPRALMRVDQLVLVVGFSGQVFTVGGWAPDSHSVLIRKLPPGGQPEVCLVSLDGDVRKLDLRMDAAQRRFGLRIHPNGRQVAFQESETPMMTQVWVLENFLIKSTANK